MATIIHGILILDGEGERIVTKYCTDHPRFSDFNKQREFEKDVTTRIALLLDRSEGADVIGVENFCVAYKSFVDGTIFFVVDEKENELVVADLTNNVFEALEIIFGKNFTHEILVRKLDLVFVLLDEIVDGPYCFEVEPSVLAQRAKMENESMGEISIGLKGFNSALEQARSVVTRNLLG